MKVIILFSGGVDSTLLLAKALSEGHECLALSFDYNQRHRVELEAARKIANHYGVEHRIVTIPNSAFSTSALVNGSEVAKNRSTDEILGEGIPSTYVPARNTLFISFALGMAESCGAAEIHYGANKLDYTCYPDCTPEYVEAFQELINTATKQSVEGAPPRLRAPLIYMTKSEIFSLGKELRIPFDMTFSCYDPTMDNEPCEACDACLLRP